MRAITRDVIAVSLFTKAGDWWGDDREGDSIGSKLWEYARSKNTSMVREDVEKEVKSALQCLVREGLVKSIDVNLRSVGNGSSGGYMMQITLQGTSGAKEEQSYEFSVT